MAEKKSITKKLQNFYNIGFQKKDNEPIVFPTQKAKNFKTGETEIKKEKFPSDIEKLWNYFLQNCHDASIDYENRKKLFEDMDMLYFNSPIISKAIRLRADEVVQADSNNQPITIESDEKFKADTQEFFDRTNINSLLRPTALEIIQYGNAGWISSLFSEGIEELIPVDIYQIKERLEFTPYEVEEKMKKRDKFFAQFSKMERMDQLIKSITNKDNYASYFKSYLLGFQVGEYVLPPWRFTHFRNITNKSPFKPWGIPSYIHSLSPYRQYDFGMTLQVVARGAKFPTEVYKLNLPNVADPTEKLHMATQFMNRLQNAGIRATLKEDPGIGDMIITIDGLYEWEQKVPDIDLGKIGDLELLRMELMLSTDLPMYIINPEDSGYGESGVSLIQKWKPFARCVYGDQGILLENISQLVKVNAIQSGKWNEKDIDFILSMPYPESQVDSEIINSQSDLLNLANDIITSLSDNLLQGDEIPPEVQKDIYQQFLPYDDSRINKWFDMIGIGETETEEQKNKLNEGYRKWNLLEKKYSRRGLRKVVKEEIFLSKQNFLREGSHQGKHYFSSKNRYLDFQAEKLFEFRKNLVKNPSDRNKFEEKLEEIKYFKKERR